jgi:ketosteroid isomerase-like protein
VTRFASRHRDVQVTLRRVVCGPDCAAVEYRWEDTKIETGERYVADDAVWVDFEAGLISRWREYWDAETPKKLEA